MLAYGLDPAVWNEEKKEMNPDFTHYVYTFSCNHLWAFLYFSGFSNDAGSIFVAV
jgi:hypothetical protein